MQISHLHYAQTGRFSGIIRDYLEEHNDLKPFYNRFPRLEHFKDQLKEKESHYAHRAALVSALQSQYSKSGISSKLLQRLSSAKTYTVTTGHQLCLITGPLYFIHKIVSTIKLAKQLGKAYAEYDFLPVFWMASEDHDFDEINHAHLFNKKLTWESGQAGAVGRMELTGISESLAELVTILGNSELAQQAENLIRESYLESKNWAEATRKLVTAIFGADSVLIVDGDDPALKKLFAPRILRELDEQISFKELEISNAALGLKYPLQVNPREINLFYLGDQLRERIVFEGGVFSVLHTTIQFSPEELKAELESHPERFSPNVILRPLYQETILPNLAYIGGGGELAYWFQLKGMFRAYGEVFPMLVLRNSVLWIGRNESKRLTNLGLTVLDLFGDRDEVIKSMVLAQSEAEITLQKEKLDVSATFDEVSTKAAAIDSTLKNMVLAEAKKAINAMDTIEKKMIKAEKDKQSQSVTQLNGLFDKLFPGGSLQERHNNYFEFYLKHGNGFLDALHQHLDPLDFRFTVITEID